MSKEYEAVKATGTQYDSLIRQAAEAEGVRYDLLHKQIFNESRFKADAKSPTGPLGIAQFTKATGRAFGLMTPEDRMDPSKAVPAMARHMRQLIDQYDGDELVASLAYNQGQGPAGAPQLEAARKGDFSALSEEGRTYMTNLSDVAQSSHADAFKALSKGTAKPAMPTQGALGLTAPKVTPQPSFDELKGTTEADPSSFLGETFKGTGDAAEAAVKTSVVGAAFRGYMAEGADLGTVMQTMRPIGHMQDNPMTDEDFATLDSMGVRPEYYRSFASAEREEWDKILPTVLGNQEYNDNFAAAGIGAQLTGGIIGAAGDPLTYVPVPGLAGGKLAATTGMSIHGAVTGAASEALRAGVVGGVSHIAAGAAGGAVLGGALGVVFGKNIHVTRGADTGADDMAPVLIRAEARATNPEGAKYHAPEGTPEATVGGVPLTPVPFEPGAVATPDGNILSAVNPINPVNAVRMEQAERAAGGIQMQGFTELGLTLGRSTDQDVLNLSGQLLRSPTGTVTGTHGRFAATASDIVERTRSQDNLSYNALTDLQSKALKDPFYSTQAGDKVSVREALDRRIVEALEDQSGVASGSLSKAERAYMDALVTHTDRKLDLLQNPGQFGNINARSLLDATRHGGHYFPVIYDNAARAHWTKLLGSRDGLQAAIEASMLRSYAARPHVKARVDKALQEASKHSGQPVHSVQDYARAKAYGVSNDPSLTSQAMDFQGATSAIGENPFLQGRHLFDSDMKVPTQHGDFSLNDLRDFNVHKVLPSYDRHVNGDVAIMGATGKTTSEIHAEALALKGATEAEREALDQTLKVLTGKARRSPDGALGSVMRSMMDTGFILKNAYMGVQNFTEMSGLITRGYMGMLTHNIPGFKELTSRKFGMKAKELNDMHAAIFGRELDDSLAPTRRDIAESLRNAGVNEALVGPLAGVRAATSWAARKSPLTEVLNGTSNYLLDAGRKGILGDIVKHVHDGGKNPFDSILLKESTLLRSASVTENQWAGVKDLIRTHMVRGPDGKLRVDDMAALTSDPRSMDLWRIADRLSDEVMIRPHKVSNLDTKAYGPMVKMLMQFKSFVVKSLNSRLMRGYHEATINGRGMDQTLTAALSVMLAGGYQVAAVHIKAQGLPEHSRRDYIEEQTSMGMLAYAALSRGSYLGSPFGIANVIAAPLGFDQAAAVRSSILPEAARPRERKEGAWLYGLSDSDSVGDFASGVLKQVPSAGTVVNLAQAGYNVAGRMGSRSADDDLAYQTGLYNAFRNLVPNDPVSQRVAAELFEDWGIDTTK